MEIFGKWFLFFIIYAFLGWIVEVVYHIFTMKKVINRGFLYGPICPIYGFGAIIMLWLLRDFESSLILTFICGAFFASILEFITGYILEKLFFIRWWDYSNMKYNIGGYVSIVFSGLWGLASIVLMRVLHPMVLSGLNLIPLRVLKILVPILFVGFIVDVSFTLMSLVEFRTIILGLREKTEEMNVKLKELNEKFSERVEDMKEEKNEFMDKLMNEIIEEKLDNRRIKFKNTHVKYLKSYPSLVSRDWVTKIKDSIKRSK